MLERTVIGLGSGWKVLAAVASIGVAVASSRYLAMGPGRSPLILANAFANPFLVIHVTAAGTALLVGPFQLVTRIRTAAPKLHRILGRLYVACCLVGAIAGFVLAFGSVAGPIATAGFGTLAVLWFITTTLAWRRAIQRRFIDHRRWMMRSWALTFAAVTLRIYLPLSQAMGFEFLEAYRAISWLCWTINLAVIEAYLLWPIARASSSVGAAVRAM